MIKKLNDDGKEVEMGDDDEIKTGDKILLCLSRGPKRIKINGKYLTENTYLGSEYKSAKEALEKAGVTVTQTNSYSSSVPAGKIISTSHTCRYKDKENEIEESQQGGIHEGDSVAVTVSDGPAPTTQAPRPTQPASGGGSSSSRSSSKTSGSKKKNPEGTDSIQKEPSLGYKKTK